MASFETMVNIVNTDQLERSVMKAQAGQILTKSIQCGRLDWLDLD